MSHPFLSEAWIDEMRTIQEEFEDKLPPLDDLAVTANLVVNDVPFGPGTIEAHIDTTSGSLEIELEHLAHAPIKVTLSYRTARRIVLDQKPEEVAKLWLMGKIRVDGDLTTLLPKGDPAELVAAATEAKSDPLADEIGERVRAMTD